MEQGKSDEFNLAAYLKVLGIPSYQKLRPTVETLYLITTKHVTNFHFQSFSFMILGRKPLDMSVGALQDRIVNKRLGGLCFEN